MKMLSIIKCFCCLVYVFEITSGQTAFEGMDFEVSLESSIKASGYDGIIYTVSDQSNEIRNALLSVSQLDKSWNTSLGLYAINLPSQRLIYSPVFSINDYHDIREIADAAQAGIQRALRAGVKRPLLVLSRHPAFPNSPLVTLLGAMEALYTNLQARESRPKQKRKIEKLGVYCNEANAAQIVSLAIKLEQGRILAKDIGQSDPERMTPIKVEEYVRAAFSPSSNISIDVISSEETLIKEYPLFAAVNRAASVIDRHKGRIIYLRYDAPSPQQTLFLVGKGVTYDSGGADVKVGGGMAGMSRDKLGAGNVAGFMRIVSALRPHNVSVIGIMSMVRNSIGENGYVSDEIITARSGKRVLVTNTDAEGRMILADCIYHAKEMAKNAVNPIIMTIATLTGHAAASVGPYPIVLDNGPAMDMHNAEYLQYAGEEIGDIIEISRIRRDDFAKYAGSSIEGVDLVQAASGYFRGHQGPAAFLILTSGLDEHGTDSSQPIPYFHLDIAGVMGQSYVSPILALAQRFLNL